MFASRSYVLLWSLVLLSLSILTVSGSKKEASDVSTQKRDSTDYKVTVYFADWDIYARNFHAQNLSASHITHVNYAFANVNPGTGEVYIPDFYAAFDKSYSGSSDIDVHNVHGCVEQLYLLKKATRNLKTLLSIGGWSYSSNFASMAAIAAGRAKFVSSAVQLVQDLGFDGLDIDWEYPANNNQAEDLVSLLQALREALDSYSSQNNLNYHFLLSIASPAGPAHYDVMHLKDMNQYVDQWNLMAFDYTGSFTKFSGHQSNLYASNSTPNATPFSTDKAIKDYIAAGVTASKIQLGIPLYGRSFENTAGLGKSFSGVGQGEWERGAWDYKVLPKASAKITMDKEAWAAYSYDTTSQELITYDTVDTVKRKAEYIAQNGLGGGMFWEASGDKTGEESLIENLVSHLGNLDQSQNLLNYPLSKYANLKAGMP